MKKENEIRYREEVKKKYYIYCPICEKEIKGNGPTHVEFNLKLHIDKHERKKEKWFALYAIKIHSRRM